MAPRVEEPVASEPLQNPSASKEEVPVVEDEQEPVVAAKEAAPEAAPVETETIPAPEEPVSSSPTACFDFNLMECCGYGPKGDCAHCGQPVLYSQLHVYDKNEEGVKTYLHQDCQEKMTKGATKIQTQVRGSLARKELSKAKQEQEEIKEKRKSVVQELEANAKAAEAAKAASKKGFFAKLFGGCKGKTTSAV
jgi:hypothetical protein